MNIIRRFVLRVVERFILHVVLIGCGVFTATPVVFAEPTAEQFASAVVSIESTIVPDGRTVSMLGDKREGTGVLIDSQGLIVTVGYLLLEAAEITVRLYSGEQLAASVAAIDAQSGLGLLRLDDTDELPAITPVKLGQSSVVAQDDRVIVLPAGGLDSAASVRVHSIREFSAPWEYLLNDAIYTMPPVRNFSGALLINRDAELIGIGTLALQDITESDSRDVPGNLFIPVDLLASRLGALISGAAAKASRPWVGVMVDDAMVVTRALDAAPAMVAGVRAGDTILGLNDRHVTTRADLYTALWMTSVTEELALLVSREGTLLTLNVKPVQRASWLVSPR
jgi:S1-C subfamily serine protease